MTTDSKCAASEAGGLQGSNKEPASTLGDRSVSDLGIHLPSLEDPPRYESQKPSLLEELCDLAVGVSPGQVRNTRARRDRKGHD